MKKLIAGFIMIRALSRYIDPGTGGMIFQVLAGMFAIVSGAVLVFAGQIKMFFSGRRRQQSKFEESVKAEENNQ